MLKQSDGLEFIYDTNGLAGLKYNNAYYFYRKDAQGNIIAILDDNGKVVVKYYYDAWGNHNLFYLDKIDGREQFREYYSGYKNKDYEKYLTICRLNPFRYRGYYYDTETGLYYLQTRYYDPEVGRFISPDSVEYADPESINGLNLYAYCANNPVMYIDPEGTKLQWWHKILIGIAFIAVGAVVTALTAGAGTGFFAALGSALLSSVIQVGISTAISAGIGIVVGGITTGTWQGALNGLFEGAVDGFMWGGIFSGGAQIISGGFKIAANLGAATGRNGGIQLAQNFKILSPNNVKFYENGGTLIKIGKYFRIDVGSKTLLHMHILGANHIQLGTILSTLFGSYNLLWKK